jgi:predicted dehydrogenase
MSLTGFLFDYELAIKQIKGDFMEKIRIAVIGLGKMGLLHTSLLNVMPDVQVIAVCDKSPLMVKLFKKVFKKTNIQVTDDLKKVPSLDLDAV